MSNIIDLNSRKRPSETPVVRTMRSSSSLIEIEDEKAFLELLKEWPCFMSFRDVSLEDIFEMYEEDELSTSQDCALEFMFHMHDPHSAFDICQALYTWDEDDKQFFMLSLNMHSELIEQIKREELSC